MTFRARTSALVLGLVVPAAVACNSAGKGDASSQGESTSGGSAESSTSGMSGPTEGGGSTDGSSVPTTDGSLSGMDHAPSGGMCNLFTQDCVEGEKCAAWSMDGSIFPNGTKCVPEMGDRQPGEDCQVEGSFGDGVDDCVAGSLCLDIDNTGMATCVAYCSGSMDDPKCPEAEQRCAFLFEPTVPLCFPPCDPLEQNCPAGDLCVPNIAALGAEYFVCMPQVYVLEDGQFGATCVALSGCNKGFQCIFGENVPGCQTDYCCSAWCDVNSPDTCTQYDPTISCVPWYEGNPTPGYEHVGICGLM